MAQTSVPGTKRNPAAGKRAVSPKADAKKAPLSAKGEEPGAPAAPIKAEAKKDEFEDYIRVPLERWWAFAVANLREFYFRLLKLNLARVVAQFAAVGVLMAVLIAIAFGLGGMGPEVSLPLALAAVGLCGILGCLAVIWLIQSFENTAYLFTWSQISRSPLSIAGGLNAVKGKTVRFVIVDVSLRTVILLPAALALVLPLVALYGAGAPPFLAFFPLFMVAYLFFLIYYYITGIIYQFLVQFWRYGFLLEGLGIVAALRKSVSLLRSHFLEALVYDIILVALYFIASIPLMVFTGVTYFGLMFLQIMAMAFPLAGIAIYLAAFLLVALAATFLSTITEVVWRPAHYEFWKKISGWESK